MQITGLGALVVTPIVGNLSDRYGRKALMTLPVTVAILPLCTCVLQFDFPGDVRVQRAH
jgi:MFS family permease